MSVKRKKQKLTRVEFSFYDISCEELAKQLLGKLLVRMCHGTRLAVRIVETEAYLGGEDQASHSYGGKRTPRNEPMFMRPGTVYVYTTYGMYNCMNISSKGDGAAVLVRAAQPIEGIDLMRQNRLDKRKGNAVKSKTTISIHDLCSGPSKLCQALSIEKNDLNKAHLCDCPSFWIEDDGFVVLKANLGSSKRIGISPCGGWENKLLRFYISDSLFVSKMKKRKLQTCD